MAALHQLFNRRTTPGWVLLGLGYVWGTFGIWARLEFITSKIQQAWPFLGNAWSVIAAHLTFESMLLLAGVIWIGVGVWRRPLPVSRPQPPVVITDPAAEIAAVAESWRATNEDVIPLAVPPAAPHKNLFKEPGGVPKEQVKILTVLAENPDANPTANMMARAIGENPTRTHYHLDRLMERGLVQDSLSMGEPSTYSLTPAGRAYLVDNNLI